MNVFPPDLPVILDRRTAVLEAGRTLLGGSPPRVLRLTAQGRQVLRRLGHTGAARSPEEMSLARRLIDAELAHPQPRASRTNDLSVTAVIPVRDRAASLERCLRFLDLPVVVVDDGSADPCAIAAICRAHGARLVRHQMTAGPAAARNTGAAHTASELIAFLDSDCVPSPGWVARLAGHFADPLVAAVAPRIRPLAPHHASATSRYLAARSPLDLGSDPGEVGPGRRVAFVPAAALIVRRAAFETAFDVALRYGEDVDLVWRLRGNGWRVRYDPLATVHHAEPHTIQALLVRRYRYGTSAGPLALRHPGTLPPAVLETGPSIVLALLVLEHPLIAIGLLAGMTARSARRLRRQGLPARFAWSGAPQSVWRTAAAASRLARTTGFPGLALAFLSRHRRSAFILLLVGPAAEWLELRPRLDPLRWLIGCLADDAAYGAGVWAGALAARTAEPLRPVLRRRGHDRHSRWAWMDPSSRTQPLEPA